jgi:hypothetical protein
MVLLRQFTIRLADVVIAGFAIHAENFVIVFVIHSCIVTPRQMRVKHPFGCLTEF